MTLPLNRRTRYTQRLLLRPFRRRDIDAVDQAVRASLTELVKWLPWAHNYERATTTQFLRDSTAAWAEGRAYDFAIRHIDDLDDHMGNVSIWWVSNVNLVGEVGYWVRSDLSGTGICTEATARVVRIGFEDLGMHRLTLRIAVGNVGSERVAEKLGFTLEGTLRDEVRLGNDWLDHTMWSMLVSEWDAARKRYTSFGWI